MNNNDFKCFFKTFSSEESQIKFDELNQNFIQPSRIPEVLKDILNNLENELEMFIKDYFLPENSEIKFYCNYDLRTQNIEIKCKDNIKEYVFLSNKSDGFKWFINLFICLRNINENSIIVIDEPERYLHPSAQKSLVKLMEKIKKENPFVQIIYSTHSPFLINKDFFPSLKLVHKAKNGSKIYNNISSYIQENKNFDQPILPILHIFGLEEEELNIILKNRKILLVEGEADIFLIDIIKNLFLNNEKIKRIDDNYFICPLLGKDNLFIVDYLKSKNIDFKVFLDEEPNNKNIVVDDNYILLNKMTEFLSPEDMLSNKTLNLYNLSDKSNHKIGWLKLRNDILLNKYNLDEIEKESFKKYMKLLKGI